MIILITGGQRSGKSTYAERRALSLSPRPVYMATARIWDDEFGERVKKHQARRGPEWTNIEEERWLSRHDVTGRVVLVDCCTLWATNFFYEGEGQEPCVERALEQLREEFDRLTQQDATFLFVTNEIGCGGVSENAAQRKFTDLLGWFNQYVAARADEVVLLVSGVAVTVKAAKRTGGVTPTEPIMDDAQLAAALRAKIDNLNKPKGSLGRLESLALQVGMIQRTLEPRLTHPCHILFGGDHGVEREGVSASPREVTWQQMKNYGRGGGGVNMFCRQHGFALRVVDVGVDYDFDVAECPHIIDRKVAHGTKNFCHEAAMSHEEWARALAVGAEQVDACHGEGCNVICFGEMGVGNTSASSVLMHLLLGIPLAECVGAGSGLDATGVRHKREVLEQAVRNWKAAAGSDTGDVSRMLAQFCGFEMAAAIGGMLRAAEWRMVVLVDGFIMTACMLAASRLRPSVMDFAVFGHCGDEGGHRRMLEAMGAEPLLRLNLRLGEGTGALCAYPLVVSAVNMLNEMDNFSHAGITKYF